MLNNNLTASLAHHMPPNGWYGTSRDRLLEVGKALSDAFLDINGIIHISKFDVYKESINCRHIDHCGGYEEGSIYVFVSNTAKVAHENVVRQWSYPGYKIDRTPVGVVAHEHGHYISDIYGGSYRRVSNMASWKKLSMREQVSGYEPCPEEAFAETMRLFITNPGLLELACPKRYRFLTDMLELKPAHTVPYLDLLNHAGDRFVKAARSWAREKV